MDATHTMKSEGRLGLEYGELSFPLRHPEKKSRNEAYDNLLQETCYGRVAVVPIFKKIKRKIKKVFRVNRS